MDASTANSQLSYSGAKTWRCFHGLTWYSLLLSGLFAALLLAFSIGKYPTSPLMIIQFFLHWMGFNVMDDAQFDT